MSFLYVDRIQSYEPQRRIVGLKNITRSEPFLESLNDHTLVARPAIVVEAMAQLSGWLAILDHDFNLRPLFLGEDRSQIHAPIPSGSQLQLEVELIRYDDELMETRGVARIDDQIVFESECGRAYLVPLATYDDPDLMRKRYKELFRPELKTPPRVQTWKDTSHFRHLKPTNLMPGPLWDAIVDHQAFEKVEAIKNIAVAEDFFDGHFTKKPVVPGVIVLSMFIDVAEQLVNAQPTAGEGPRRMALQSASQLRFRKMISPGDTCCVKIKVKKWSPANQRLEVTAAAYVGDQRVAQAQLEFHVGTTDADRAFSPPLGGTVHAQPL